MDNQLIKGFIYKISHPNYDKFYIGSTRTKLSKRFNTHVFNFKKDKACVSKEILKHGYENCKIELIEEYLCNNKQELLKREGQHIRNNINNVVNLRIAGREYSEYRKENKEKFKQYFKEYNQLKKAEISKQKKQYYNINKNRIKERNKKIYETKKEYYKQYREQNKEKMKEYQKLYRINKI